MHPIDTKQCYENRVCELTTVTTNILAETVCNVSHNTAQSCINDPSCCVFDLFVQRVDVSSIGFGNFTFSVAPQEKHHKDSSWGKSNMFVESQLHGRGYDPRR